MSIRMTKIPKTDIPNAYEDVEQQEILFIDSGNAKWCSHFRRQFDTFLKN